MKIGIDVSQLAYPGTGVATYLEKLVENLIETDKNNEYILFFSSFRGKLQNLHIKQNSWVQIKKFRLPPSVLDLLWNKLHIFPIESFVGELDIFVTSDWTEPPVKRARKITILYDLIVYKYPSETDKKIVNTQKRKLAWVKKESERIICISESTAKDAQEILGINKNKLVVVYPGF